MSHFRAIFFMERHTYSRLFTITSVLRYASLEELFASEGSFYLRQALYEERGQVRSRGLPPS